MDSCCVIATLAVGCTSPLSVESWKDRDVLVTWLPLHLGPEPQE